MNTDNEEDEKVEILKEFEQYCNECDYFNHRIWAYEKIKSLMGKAFAYRDAEVERLRNDLDDALDLKAGNGPTALSRVVQERDTLKKQVEEMRTEREFELAYCFGLMASDGITIDRMAEATTSERWTKIKEEIKKLNQPLT